MTFRNAKELTELEFVSTVPCDGSCDGCKVWPSMEPQHETMARVFRQCKAQGKNQHLLNMGRVVRDAGTISFSVSYSVPYKLAK